MLGKLLANFIPETMAKDFSTREEDYSKWYNDIVIKADLAEHSDVRGCMIIKPHGFAVWEMMKDVLDKKFKDTGHQNAYFPLLIPIQHSNPTIINHAIQLAMISFVLST